MSLVPGALAKAWAFVVEEFHHREWDSQGPGISFPAKKGVADWRWFEQKRFDRVKLDLMKIDLMKTIRSSAVLVFDGS